MSPLKEVPKGRKTTGRGVRSTLLLDEYEKSMNGRRKQGHFYHFGRKSLPRSFQRSFANQNFKNYANPTNLANISVIDAPSFLFAFESCVIRPHILSLSCLLRLSTASNFSFYSKKFAKFTVTAVIIEHS